MKQKTLKRLLSLLLAGVMVAGTLTACGSKPAEKQESVAVSEKESVSTSEKESTPVSEPEEKGVTYPIDEKVTLTLALKAEANVTSSGAKHLFETPFGKAWQENTGVTIDVIQVADDNALNLLIAGGELPDLIMFDYQSSCSMICAFRAEIS